MPGEWCLHSNMLFEDLHRVIYLSPAFSVPLLFIHPSVPFCSPTDHAQDNACSPRPPYICSCFVLCLKFVSLSLLLVNSSWISLDVMSSKTLPKHFWKNRLLLCTPVTLCHNVFSVSAFPTPETPFTSNTVRRGLPHIVRDGSSEPLLLNQLFTCLPTPLHPP